MFCILPPRLEFSQVRQGGESFPVSPEDVRALPIKKANEDCLVFVGSGSCTNERVCTVHVDRFI